MTKMLPNSGWCLPPIVHNLHWESFLPAPELLSPTPETSRFSVLMSQLCQSSASACVSGDLTQSLFCGGKFCGCWLQCWPTLVGLFKQHMLALSSRSRQPDKSILKRNTEAWKSTETRIKIRLYSTSQTLKRGVDKNTRTTTPRCQLISISYVIAHSLGFGDTVVHFEIHLTFLILGIVGTATFHTLYTLHCLKAAFRLYLKWWRPSHWSWSQWYVLYFQY